MQEKEQTGLPAGPCALPVDRLAPGLYWLEARSGAARWRQKLVVLR
jgi:hypothetical protein